MHSVFFFFFLLEQKSCLQYVGEARVPSRKEPNVLRVCPEKARCLTQDINRNIIYCHYHNETFGGHALDVPNMYNTYKYL